MARCDVITIRKSSDESLIAIRASKVSISQVLEFPWMIDTIAHR